MLECIFFPLAGPYIVAFGTESKLFYWSVDRDHFTVGATDNPLNASVFFINPNDDGKHPYEFQIAYSGDDLHLLRRRISSLTTQCHSSLEPMARYLCAPVSLFGFNRGPLHLKNNVSSNSQFLLGSRLKKDELVNTHAWVQGRDMFFINCTRRRGRRDGYLCTRLRRRGGQEEWVTACVPSTHFHNEQDTFMLFRLLPASHRERTNLPSNGTTDTSGPEPIATLDEQLKNYEKGSAPESFRVPASPRPKRFPFPLGRSGASTETLPTSQPRVPRVRFDVGNGPMLELPSSAPPPLAEPSDSDTEL